MASFLRLTSWLLFRVAVIYSIPENIPLAWDIARSCDENVNVSLETKERCGFSKVFRWDEHSSWLVAHSPLIPWQGTKGRHLYAELHVSGTSFFLSHHISSQPPAILLFLPWKFYLCEVNVSDDHCDIVVYNEKNTLGLWHPSLAQSA